MKYITYLLLTTILLTGCVLGDRRQPQTVFEDDSIDAQIHYLISNDPDPNEFGANTNINAATYNHKVLLIGQVPDEATKQRASKLANSLENVQTVYNELTIGPPTGLVQRTTDSWITTHVKSSIATENSYGLNQIKVVTENNVVYLMGIVTQQEAQIAVTKAQNVKGVKEVVKFFEYVAT